MELADPDFYKIGYVRSFRAYGIEFREGPDGYGVFASKDVEPLRRARVSTTLKYVCTQSLFLLQMECLTLPSETVSNSVLYQRSAVPKAELHPINSAIGNWGEWKEKDMGEL